MQDQQPTAHTAGPKGMHFSSQQIFSDFGFLFSHSLSLDQQRNHSVLASSAESISEKPLRIVMFAKWETSPSCHHTWPGGMEEILAGIHKNISYLAN